MKNIKSYYLFIFITTLTRNIIDIYSVIYLYQKNISIKNIIAIYVLIYFFGIFIAKYSIIIGNKIGYKYILIISAITTSVTFYILTVNTNVYVIAFLISLSIFTYHPIRHLYGIKLSNSKKDISGILIYIYIANFLSSVIIIKSINVIYLIIIAILGIIPTLFIETEKADKIIYPTNINHNKLCFFFFDQFRITFLLLEPLFLYLISNAISYVGYFNIILTISSVICIHYIASKIEIAEKYKYINLIFVIILLLKLNINNQYILLIIALLEGIGIRINELVSTINLYDYHKPNIGYIIICEQLFCLTRVLILGILYFLPINLKLTLYLLIIGIFLLGFQYKKDTI